MPHSIIDEPPSPTYTHPFDDENSRPASPETISLTPPSSRSSSPGPAADPYPPVSPYGAIYWPNWARSLRYGPDNEGLASQLRWLQQGHSESWTDWVTEASQPRPSGGPGQHDWVSDLEGPNPRQLLDYSRPLQSGETEATPVWRYAREKLMEALTNWAEVDARVSGDKAPELEQRYWEEAQYHLDVLHAEVYQLRDTVEASRRRLNFLTTLQPDYIEVPVRPASRETRRQRFVPRTPEYFPPLQYVLENVANQSILPPLRPQNGRPTVRYFRPWGDNTLAIVRNDPQSVTDEEP